MKRSTADRQLDPYWSHVLDVLPLPAAVLDPSCRYILLNLASGNDPILAHSQIGHTDLDLEAGDPALLDDARVRHRTYEQSLRSHHPCWFAERPDRMENGTSGLWLCVPVEVEGEERLVVIGLPRSTLTDTGSARATGEAAATAGRLIDDINQELRAPLAAIVGVAGTLAHELSGEQQQRAALIDSSGRRLLSQLSALLERAASAPA